MKALVSKYKELGRDELVHMDLTGPTSLSNVQHARRCRIEPTTSATTTLFYNFKRKYENANAVEKTETPAIDKEPHCSLSEHPPKHTKALSLFSVQDPNPNPNPNFYTGKGMAASLIMPTSSSSSSSMASSFSSLFSRCSVSHKTLLPNDSGSRIYAPNSVVSVPRHICVLCSVV